MATAYKILYQSNPAVNTLTNTYAVPALTSTVVSSIVVCNQGLSSAKFRVSAAAGAAVDSANQYLYYDEVIPANKTFIATVGITLATTDLLRIYTDSASLSFSFFGSEIT